MRIKFIEQWKFRMLGRAVPVIKLEDIDEIGRATTLHILGPCKKRANSIVSTWDSKTWEIDKAYGSIRVINEKGIESQAYVVSESGKTVPIMTQCSAFPNREDVLGRLSSMDDISDSLDLGKSMKNLVIGLIVGLGIGAFFLGPVIQAMLK